MKIKKTVFILCLLIISIFVCGCKERTNKPESDDTLNNSPVNNEKSYLCVDLPQLGKTNQRVYHTAWGHLVDEPRIDEVLLISNEQTEAIQSDVYLIADIGGNFLVYDFGKWDTTVFDSGSVFTADLDGDSIDEIIVNFEVTTNGYTLFDIFKVNNGSLELIQNLDENLDFFRGEYIKGRKFRIYCDSIGFSCDVDISYCFDEFFDSDGVALIPEEIPYIQLFMTHSCTLLESEDKCDFVCSASVKTTVGYLGTMNMTFSYDEIEKMMKLSDASFEPYIPRN